MHRSIPWMTSAIAMLLVASLATAETFSFQEGVSPSGVYTMHAVTIRSNATGINTSQNGSDQIIVGPNLAAGQTGDSKLRGLLKFDISAITTQITQPYTVTDVQLVLRQTDQGSILNNGVIPMTVNVLQFNSDFDEATVTWNNLAPPGGDTSGTLLSSLSLDPLETNVDRTFTSTPNFLATVEAALAGDGFLRLMLRNPNDLLARQEFVRFAAESDPTPEFRPELIITVATIPEPVTITLWSVLGTVTLGWVTLRRMRCN